MKADLPKFPRQFGCLAVGNVDEEQILRDSCAQRSAAEALGKFGGGFQLLAAHPAAQHRCANVAQAGLALRMNARMVAEDVLGNLLGHAGQQREVESRLQFCKKTLGGPAFFQKEILHAGLAAVFP